MNRHERRKQRAVGTDPRLTGMELRYGGRTLIVTTYLNTDQDAHEAALRMQEAARGPNADMCIVTVAEVEDRQAAAEMWSTMFEKAERHVKHEGQA